jgi:hypothetical protein
MKPNKDKRRETMKEEYKRREIKKGQQRAAKNYRKYERR